MPGPVNPPPIQRRQRLAHARTELAHFQYKGQERARQLGLSHVQHHLLLAVHAHPQDHPGVAMVADHLALRGNSAAELVNRTVDAGYLRRAPRTPRTGAAYSCTADTAQHDDNKDPAGLPVAAVP